MATQATETTHGFDAHVRTHNARLSTPRYMLLTYYDRWTRISVAKLMVMLVPMHGWRLLDEQVVAGDDVPSAVLLLRINRVLARNFARAS